MEGKGNLRVPKSATQSLSPELNVERTPEKSSPEIISPNNTEPLKENINEDNNDDYNKLPKRTTAQQRLQQKLMSEALQKVEFKKAATKHFTNVTRTNPTIAAMEIMTRKELKAGEMEQRLARGEIPTIPIQTTPEHFKKDDPGKNSQHAFFENLAAQSMSNRVQQDLKRSESMKMNKPMLSPKPSFHKRLSQENIGAVSYTHLRAHET